MLVVNTTGHTAQRASFSDYGAWVSLAAPGIDIVTTNSSGSYSSWSGTSFSAPIVAGVAGLMLSANYSLRYQDVMQLLESTADDIGTAGKDNYFGYGKVNVDRAVASAIAVLPTASNFMSNPCFEYGPTPWTTTGTTAIVTKPHSGTESAYAKIGSGWSQVVKLLPNTTYTLSAWVEAGVASTVQICATEYGGANVRAKTTGQTYQKLSVSFTTGAASTAVTVISNVPRGEAWMDDFSVTRP